MKSPWKIGLILTFIVLSLSGSGLLWLAHKRKAFEKEVVELANSRRIRAEQGDPKAESELAYMYSHGQGVPQDYGEALRWRRKSAEQGYAPGEAGLAFMYLHGQGVKQDNTEALNWFRKAAAAGDAYAENNLGIFYEEGELLPQDYAEAVRWYRKAADQSFPAAEFNLGNIYYYGKGVPRDIPEAYRWFRKAAAHGDEYSQQLLGLRGRGIGSTYAICLSICTLGILLLLAGPLFQKDSTWNRPSQSATVAGLVGLGCVGLDVYAQSKFSVFPTELFAHIFTFARFVLSGVFIFLLTRVIAPLALLKRARVTLGILGISLVSFNVWAIAFTTAHRVALISSAAGRLFVTTNGMIIGIGIPVVTSLLHNRSASTPDHNDDGPGFEDANEDE